MTDALKARDAKDVEDLPRGDSHYREAAFVVRWDGEIERKGDARDVVGVGLALVG